jgi:hypothetical protein
MKKIPPPAAPLSPAMAALAQINGDILHARVMVRDAEATIERLRGIVAADQPAQRALQDAVAADGGEDLARLAGGTARAETVELIAAAEGASRAAAVAGAALPRAERDLADAVADVERLIAVRMKRIEAVLLERADEVARQYRAAFKELCRLHDVLVGAARGSALVAPIDIIISNVPIEVARFNLPALKGSNPEYSPFFRHIPNPITVNAAADEFAALGRQLAADLE